MRFACLDLYGELRTTHDPPPSLAHNHSLSPNPSHLSPLASRRSSLRPSQFVKIIELVLESVPESILQASVIMDSEDEHVNFCSKVSLASSVCAAGLLLADLNYTVESTKMKEQQTPGVHPLYGYIRDSAFGQAALVLSSWAFLSFYVFTTVFAFGCLLIKQPWWVFICIPTVEVWVLVGIKWAQGEGSPRFVLTETPAFFIVYYIMSYITLTAAPLFQLRVSD